MKLKTRGRFSGAENLRFYHRELWRLDSYSLDIYTELSELIRQRALVLASTCVGVIINCYPLSLEAQFLAF